MQPAEEPAVTIRVRESGPLLVTGPIKLTDHTGREYQLPAGSNVALCRCGASAIKPFCDGTHRTCGFIGTELAPEPLD